MPITLNKAAPGGGLLLAYYGGRIAAARFGLSPTATIKAILAEQIVATRALMDRWQSATRNQAERPPTTPTRLCADQPKLT